MPDGVTESKYMFNQWEIGNNFLTSVFTFDQSPVKTEVAELKSAGIDNIIAEKQKQLDAWSAANDK